METVPSLVALMREHYKELVVPREQIERNCSYDPVTGCLEWLGATNDAGYGRTWNQFGKVVSTHRAALAHKLRRPIRPGYDASHLCGNTICAEKSHLWEELHLDNVSRKRNTTGRWLRFTEAEKRLIQAHDLEAQAAIDEQRPFNLRISLPRELRQKYLNAPQEQIDTINVGLGIHYTTSRKLVTSILTYGIKRAMAYHALPRTNGGHMLPVTAVNQYPQHQVEFKLWLGEPKAIRTLMGVVKGYDYPSEYCSNAPRGSEEGYSNG